MKTKIRKGLSILLIAAFCFGILISPVGVAEAENVYSLEQLIAAINGSDEKIYLMSDINLDQTININRSLTIDGQGKYTLTSVSDKVYIPIKVYGTGAVCLRSLKFKTDAENAVQNFIYSDNVERLVVENNEFISNNVGSGFSSVLVQNGGISELKNNTFTGKNIKPVGAAIRINSGTTSINDNTIQYFVNGIEAVTGTVINGWKVPAINPEYKDYKSIDQNNILEHNNYNMVGFDSENKILWTNPTASNDSSLRSLKLKYQDKPIELDFKPDVLSYEVILPKDASGDEPIILEAVPSSSGAVVESVWDKTNMTYTVKVTAEDGTLRNYIIKVIIGKKLSVQASDDSITMNQDNLTVSRDHTWSIDVTKGTVKRDLTIEDLKITSESLKCIPQGLICTARKGTRNNILITVSGEVYKEQPITETRDVEIAVLKSAVEEKWVLEDAEPVTLKIYPGGVIHIRGEAEDDAIRMQAPYFKTVDPADNSWKIKVIQGKVKPAAAIQKDSVSLLTLPKDLDYSVQAISGNSLLITVSGSVYGDPIVSPITDIQAIVKGAAVIEEGAIDSPPITLRIEVGGPNCINYEPSGTGWFDEKNLFPRKVPELQKEQQLFLRLTFEDVNNELRLTDDAFNALRRSTVSSQGGSQESMIDLDFLQYIEGLDEDARKAFINTYVFNKESGKAYLYIPVKPLRSQTAYDVAVASGIVRYEKGCSNDPVQWSFSTTAYPQVSGISLGSVGEDYDADEPIIVTGDHFYTGGSIQVLFNDTPARRVEVVSEQGKHYLKVYLPSGGSRLKAGVYNVTVINKGKYQETLYGQFSVIAAAKGTAPEDGKHIKDRPREGDVIASVNSSEDTLELNSRYTNRSYLELDLDELMGETSWQRRIVYDACRGDRIGELKLVSSWATVSLFGLGSNTSYRNDKIEIRTGRAAPIQAKSLIAKLGRMQTCSNVIEVTGKNFGVERVAVAIPYRNLGDKPLKVMRYDEYGRRWYEVAAGFDRVNQMAIAANTRPGYFVVVE